MKWGGARREVVKIFWKELPMAILTTETKHYQTAQLYSFTGMGTRKARSYCNKPDMYNKHNLLLQILEESVVFLLLFPYMLLEARALWGMWPLTPNSFHFHVLLSLVTVDLLKIPIGLCLGSIIIIQNNPLTSRSLSTPAKSCLPCKEISKWFRENIKMIQGLGCRHLGKQYSV